MVGGYGIGLRTMDGVTSVLGWVPVFLFSAGTRNDDVASVLSGGKSQGSKLTPSKEKGETNLRVGLDLEPTTAKVALAPERKYGRRVVHADLLLLCIVANTHAYVGIASSTSPQTDGESRNVRLYDEGNVHTTRC